MDIAKNNENTNIGMNIRRIRKGKEIRQTELIQRIDLEEWDFEANLTREALVKIGRGIQHIKVSQLKAIKVILETTYDELLEQAAVDAGNRFAVVLCGMDGSAWNRYREHFLGGLEQAGGVRATETHDRRSVAGLNQMDNCLWKISALVKKEQLFQPVHCHKVNQKRCRMAGYGEYQYPVQCFRADVGRVLSGRPGELASLHDTILQQS